MTNSNKVTLNQNSNNLGPLTLSFRSKFNQWHFLYGRPNSQVPLKTWQMHQRVSPNKHPKFEISEAKQTQIEDTGKIKIK